MLVDSHCHLDFPDFADELDAVVERAREAGVTTMVTICTRLSEFERVRDIAERFPEVFCSVGVHPHEAAEESGVSEARLVELAGHPKVVGIGETGLDFFYEHSPRDEQRASFRIHAGAARASGLPLIVHSRDADRETADILTEEMGQGAFPGLIHCFSSSAELAQRALDLGLYISLAGIVTFKKADALREVVRGLPLDRLLLETDAPYLAPVPRRGKRNEPAYVAHTAACVAEIKGLSVDRLAAATSANFRTLFAKATVPESAP